MLYNHTIRPKKTVVLGWVLGSSPKIQLKPKNPKKPKTSKFFYPNPYTKTQQFWIIKFINFINLIKIDIFSLILSF